MPSGEIPTSKSLSNEVPSNNPSVVSSAKSSWKKSDTPITASGVTTIDSGETSHDLLNKVIQSQPGSAQSIAGNQLVNANSLDDFYDLTNGKKPIDKLVINLGIYYLY